MQLECHRRASCRRMLDGPVEQPSLVCVCHRAEPPNAPATVCASPRDAALWLAGRGARIDPLMLTEALEQQVPRRYRVVP